MLCELIVSKCRIIKYIKVVTIKDPKPSSDQEKALNILSNSLSSEQNIVLDIDYSDTIHDREIMFVN